MIPKPIKFRKQSVVRDCFQRYLIYFSFVQCFLNNEYPSGKPVFSEKMVEAIWNTNCGGRTFGWEVKRTQTGELYLYHTGFTGTSIGMKKKKRSPNSFNKSTFILIVKNVDF